MATHVLLTPPLSGPRTSVNTVTVAPGKRLIYPPGVCYVLAQIA
jgi:hypothetical protein